MDWPACQRYGSTYALRESCDPTPECDECAHIALAELREAAGAHLERDSSESYAELRRLCGN